MSLNLSNFQNIGMQAIESIEKFLKRDFFELNHIRDPQKIENFFKNTIEKNLQRIMENLQQRNSNYGVISKGKIIKESESGIYWIIEVVDDKFNFINSINYWGVNISIYTKKDNKLSNTLFYMPITNDIYVATDLEGFFVNNRKTIILPIKPQIIISNLTNSKITTSLAQRNFGSEILSIFFRASSKIDKLYLPSTDYCNLLVALVLKEAKGSYKLDNHEIEI